MLAEAVRNTQISHEQAQKRKARAQTRATVAILADSVLGL